MNIEQANKINLSLILEKLGRQPVSETDDEAIYLAPWQDDGEPDLKTDKRTNTWFDKTLNKSGNAIGMVGEYLKANGNDHTQADSLRWLENMQIEQGRANKKSKKETKRSKWHLIREEPVENPALIRYLESKGISVVFGKKHLQEIFVRYNKTGEKYTCIGIKNEDGGFAFQNPYRKGLIIPDAITFINSPNNKNGSVHIFENFIDFLTYLTIKKRLYGDIIVLNSGDNAEEAIGYIKGFGYRHLFTWMKNDDAGKRRTEKFARFCGNQPGLKHQPQNKTYMPKLSLNDWHRYNLNLKIKQFAEELANGGK